MQVKKKFIGEKILEAARNEYGLKGYRQANISVIAQNAGIPAGNLYRYFDGKPGLLDALVKHAYAEVPQQIDRLGEAGITPASLTEAVCDILNAYGKEILILADGCATTRYEDFVRQITAQIADILYERARPGGNADRRRSRIAARAFTGAMLDILRLNLAKNETAVLAEKVIQDFHYGYIGFVRRAD